jgi:threonine dehydratase
MKAARPAAEVIGVEAEASCAFSASREAGHLVTVDVRPTIADGLGGNVEPESRTWPYVRDLVSRIVKVSEDDLAKSIHGLLGEEHLVAEGAGAAAVGAIVGRRLALEGRRVAIIVTGANIDLSLLRSLM